MKLTVAQLRRIIKEEVENVVEAGKFGLTSKAPRAGRDPSLPDFAADGMTHAADVTEFVRELEGTIDWEHVHEIFDNDSQNLGKIYEVGGNYYLAWDGKGNGKFVGSGFLDALVNSGAENIPSRPHPYPTAPVAKDKPFLNNMKGNFLSALPLVFGK